MLNLSDFSYTKINNSNFVDLACTLAQRKYYNLKETVFLVKKIAYPSVVQKQHSVMPKTTCRYEKQLLYVWKLQVTWFWVWLDESSDYDIIIITRSKMYYAQKPMSNE